MSDDLQDVMCQEIEPDLVMIFPIGKNMLLEQRIIGEQQIIRRISVKNLDKYLETCYYAS